MTKHVFEQSLASAAAQSLAHLDPAEIRRGIHRAEQEIPQQEQRKIGHGPRAFTINNRNDGALIKNAPALKLRRSQNR